MGSDHGAVLSLVELYTELGKPADCVRSFINQLVKKVLLSCEMSAAECIQEVLSRRVIRLISSLNTAFCHHGVGITHTKLGYNGNLCTIVVCFDCCCTAGTAATDDQYVGIVVRFSKGKGIEWRVLSGASAIGCE